MAAVEQFEMSVVMLLLTHGHIDHAGGATELKDRLTAKQAISPLIVGPDLRDKFLLDDLAQQGRDFGLAGAQNCAPDRWLKEGEAFEILGEPFIIMHCPGHTPGHLVFVSHQLKLILMGDVLFKGSIGRTDFPYGDTDALINAIKTKIMALDDDFNFICGHGPGSTLGDERASNPFLQ